MTALFPVWPTTKAILLYCWRERALAVRYGAIPVILLVLLDVVGTLAGVDIGEDRVWQLVSGAAALLAYAPPMVTWYRSIVFGEDQARQRPPFSFGWSEGAVFMTYVLVSLVGGLAVFALGIAVLLCATAVAQLSAVAGQAAAVILAVPAAFIAVMVWARLSVALAYAAIGRHSGIRNSWRVTRSIAVSITWIYIIVAAIGMGLDFAGTGAVDAGLEAVGFGNETGQPAPVLDLTVSAVDAVLTLACFLLTTTLFGFAYRHIVPSEPTAGEPTPQESR